MKYKNIIIASSGTGGHIYPGIALAKEFAKNGYNPIFFITNNEISIEILRNNGFKYILFNLSGMPRKISFSFWVFLSRLFLSFLKALKNIAILKPVFVIGTGGYISVPALVAAKILKNKTFIHEQNTIPGKANIVLNKIVDKTFISFEYSRKYFKNANIVFSGYPVREEILHASKTKALENLDIENDIFTILVFGGSLGAVKLNEVACKSLLDLSKSKQVQAIHITGYKSYSNILKLVELNKNYQVFKYMHNISDAYAVSDVAICRCGAGTVFEIKALNKPAVFVPYPYATDNHQYWNAKEVEEDNKFILIEEKDLTEKKLKETIEILLSNPKKSGDICFSKLPQTLIFKEIIQCIKS
ncbi:MAG: undecaprenyldiphospho-muramoylpentapeptide beta-N-acetylglucosaminyltransferase [Endomicrobium sp.]|jgi:UDP-N-acetylglucosamine--N-acetylmuramyl-(pentapeptide) pyrophosphoryl-undecaprenol N-acetylglucosamine transferase|uniref:undecaprenyldiphospho-muramoylpentapeptide beta-N-acetylglucosaminyltransferase n=1 Tax=Candidatus Endomicrobiellum cubanum TaxID=3242325 RepID=UPI0028278700|nr:undecaprenyldiphospho-muramoylpentapeptide beta-N-acetylglucosaminyltransferase [Endomicrobium sp.]MDR2395201.1 undecaprenyldiphospho-muramoylpentapeptide beta-N-acetylglucosaminyltransferase [Endomicrobium sp.]